MEMFDWREKIQETEKKSDKLKLQQEVKAIIQDSMEQFNSHVVEKEEKQALKEAIRLKYYCKMLEEFEDLT